MFCVSVQGTPWEVPSDGTPATVAGWLACFDGGLWALAAAKAGPNCHPCNNVATAVYLDPSSSTATHSWSTQEGTNNCPSTAPGLAGQAAEKMAGMGSMCNDGIRWPYNYPWDLLPGSLWPFSMLIFGTRPPAVILKVRSRIIYLGLFHSNPYLLVWASRNRTQESAFVINSSDKFHAHCTRLACKLHIGKDYTSISYSLYSLYRTQIQRYSCAPMFFAKRMYKCRMHKGNKGTGKWMK